MNYSDRFSAESAAANYDDVQYGDTSYSSLLWRIERRQLDEVLMSITHGRRFDYLDFACGSGRVLRHVSPRTASARGIEISPAMAKRAREKVPGATVDCRDITAPGADMEGDYDVITAFRFILNAEPSLRARALQCLVRRMRDTNSVIIFNNHGNLASHKVILFPLHMIRRKVRRECSGNYLSHRAVVDLASRCGLVAERVAGCGFVGGRIFRVLPTRAVEKLESWFAASRFSILGSNQIYVARRRVQ